MTKVKLTLSRSMGTSARRSSTAHPPAADWSVLAACFFLLLLAGDGRAAFNEIIAGARPQGLGGAFVSVADDANALVWNPAGIVQLATAEATFMHANEFDLSVGPELVTDFVGFVNWPTNLGMFGISAYQQGADEVLQERVLSLSYARPVFEHASIGVNVKALEMVPNATQVVNPDDPALVDQATMSFDLGALVWLTPQWSVGMMARNLAGEIGAGLNEELQTTYRIGSSYRFEDLFFLDDALLWTGDFFTKTDIGDQPGLDIGVATGLEYTLAERVTFRTGVNRGDLALGIGFGHPEVGIFIDYAYSDDEIGDTHRIAATYRFGLPPSEVHVVHHEPPAHALPPPPPGDLEPHGFVAEPAPPRQAPPPRQSHGHDKVPVAEVDGAYYPHPPVGPPTRSVPQYPEYSQAAPRQAPPPPKAPRPPSEFSDELKRFLAAED